MIRAGIGAVHPGRLRLRAQPFRGRVSGWGLCMMLAAGMAGADTVMQVQLHSGNMLAEWPMPEGAELQLSWAHSVTGGPVADCFIHSGGRLVLTRSYLHDFAAGLGEVQGRGRLVSAPEGGYWIEGIDMALPDNRLSLRIGAAQVGHMLRQGAGACDPDPAAAGLAELPLSQIAAGEGVWLTLLQPADDAQHGSAEISGNLAH